MTRDLFNRYIWLVETIYRSEKITLKEINKRWLRTGAKKEIPLRTFHNHRHAIESMFDINIECDAQHYYYIENRDDIENSNIKSWLLSTFAVNNLLHENQHLRQRILLEAIPSGQQYLTQIIEAMHNSRVLEVTYQSFQKSTPHLFKIEPYCVKLFKQRWYVLARSPHYDTVQIYALDRIHALQETDETFMYPEEFNPEAYFASCFGIITDERFTIETVRIKVSANQRNYFRVLPLHHSQKEIETTDNYSVFEYVLRPTYDFRQEVLSHGSEVEVLAPKWFRSQVIEEITKLRGLYG